MWKTKMQTSLCSQTVRSVSALVVHCFNSITPVVAKSKIPRLLLTSEAEQAGLSLTWLCIPEDRFSQDLVYVCGVYIRVCIHLFFYVSLIISFIDLVTMLTFYWASAKKQYAQTPRLNWSILRYSLYVFIYQITTRCLFSRLLRGISIHTCSKQCCSVTFSFKMSWNI